MILISETGPMKTEHEVRLDRTEWGMMRWMCGFILKERQKNTELKELLGLRKVGIGIVVFNVPLDTL